MELVKLVWIEQNKLFQKHHLLHRFPNLCVYLIFLLLLVLRCFILGVEVFNHATNDVHNSLICAGIAKIKFVSNSCQLEQVLDAFFVLFGVATPVHEDTQAYLLSQYSVLLQADSPT